MNALRQFWYPVLWSEEVADKPVAVKLLDQPLVVWRADREVSAFYDLCIHRGAALSLGWVNRDQLVCGYTAGTTPRTAVARAYRRCRQIAKYRPRRALRRIESGNVTG